MAIKKSQLYSSLWSSCDELRGGMDASQYKDYILTLLFMKYVSDKCADNPAALIEVPKGGGFRYFRLGPSLLRKDEWGNWVINTDFNPEMLAEAVCKLEGFTYAPSDEVYWQHGHSTETDFIYVTTQSMNREMLTRLSDEVGEKRSLLVVCKAFRVKPDAFENLTLKKIPKAVLRKCEWGKDDYSLEIRNLPAAPQAAEEDAAGDVELKKPGRKFGKGKDKGPTLFSMEGV